MFENNLSIAILIQCLMSIVDIVFAVKFWAIDTFLECKSSIHMGTSFEIRNVCILEDIFFTNDGFKQSHS